MTVQATQSTQATMVTMIDRFSGSLGLATTADPTEGIAVRWEALLAAGVTDPGAAFAAWLQREAAALSRTDVAAGADGRRPHRSAGQ